LRDANGCASLQVDLGASIWVRPGTLITVTVPIRSTPERTSLADQKNPILPEALAARRSSSALSPTVQVRIYNGSNETITGYRTAPLAGIPENRVYGNYSEVRPFLDRNTIPPGQSGYVEVNEYRDVAFVTDGGVVFRQEVDPSQPGLEQIDVPDIGPMGTARFSNNTGTFVSSIYAGNPVEGGPDYFGGNNLLDRLETGQPGQITWSAGSQAGVDRYLLALDGRGVYHPIKVHTFPGTGNSPVSLDADYGELDVINRYPQNICDFGLAPYDENEADTKPSLNRPLNLLQFLTPYAKYQLLPNGQVERLRIAKGTYYWRAYYCDGTLAGDGKVEITGSASSPNLTVLELQCQNKASLGPNKAPLQKNPRLNRPDALFEEHCASLPMSSGVLRFTICTNEFSDETTAGRVLIDPDGYVYNAVLGFGVKVPGATVTCDVYDEDYQSWSRWPAELYESQINPQVTQNDGYYAFFVPPGKYRVTAIAPNYQPHTSPVIEVVNAIVHYNIPLTSLLKLIYLPISLRP
jgi:hypothetical protein